MNRSSCPNCGAEHNGPFDGCPGPTVRQRKTASWHGTDVAVAAHLYGGHPIGAENLADVAERMRERFRQHQKSLTQQQTAMLAGLLPQQQSSEIFFIEQLKKRIVACDAEVEDAFVYLLENIDRLGVLISGTAPSPDMRRVIVRAVLALADEEDQ